MIEAMDVSSSLTDRAARHSALADPIRLRIVDLLTLGDATPSELRRLFVPLSLTLSVVRFSRFPFSFSLFSAIAAPGIFADADRDSSSSASPMQLAICAEHAHRPTFVRINFAMCWSARRTMRMNDSLAPGGSLEHG